MAKMALYRIIEVESFGSAKRGFEIESATPTTLIVEINFEDDEQIVEMLHTAGRLKDYQDNELCIEGDWEALTISDDETGEPLLQLKFVELSDLATV
jgi:hypothetical protein